MHSRSRSQFNQNNSNNLLMMSHQMAARVRETIAPGQNTIQPQHTQNMDARFDDSQNLDTSLLEHNTMPANMPLTPSGTNDMHRMVSLNNRFVSDENLLMLDAANDGMNGRVETSIIQYPEDCHDNMMGMEADIHPPVHEVEYVQNTHEMETSVNYGNAAQEYV